MEKKINLIDYWQVLLKRKKLIVLIVAAITGASIPVTLLMKKVYKANALIMVVGGAPVSGLSGIASQLGLIGGGNSSPTQLVTIFQSQTLAEQVIEKHGIVRILYPEIWDDKKQEWKIKDPRKWPSMEDIVRDLKELVKFKDDKRNNLITVMATFNDPVTTADLANWYIKELSDYLNNNSLTAAKRNRIFIERQIARTKAELLESGKELADFYATNKISNVTPTVDVDVSIEDQPEEIVDEMKVGPAGGVMSGEQTPSLPGVTDAFAQVQKQAEELQKKAESVKTEINKAKIVRGVPEQIYLHYLTLRRELLGQVNILLTQQYEMAKIEESKEDLNFQVIDWARVPTRRFKPMRRKIVMATFLVSSFMAILAAFLIEGIEKAGGFRVLVGQALRGRSE